MPDTELLPPRDHNAPPLAELLPEETAVLKARADILVAEAGRVKITDEDSAARATALARLISEHWDKIDKARETRKAPFLEGGRTVDAHFKALGAPLVGLDPAKKKQGVYAQVLAQIDTFRREQEARAAAERARLAREAEEARQRAEAAERARQAAERKAAAATSAAEAAKASQAATAAELDARRAAETAEQRTQAAAATEAPRIAGWGATAGARNVWTHAVTDFDMALSHALGVNRQAFVELVDDIIKKQIRAGIREWPGATIRSETQTQIRRG